MKDIINSLKTFGTWNVPNCTDQECVKHLKSDNIEIMIYGAADKVIQEHVISVFKRYQIGLETWLKGSDFVFDCVHLLYCKSHKINLNRGGSYIDSSDLMENKNATLNSINDDDKRFQYAATVALNQEVIGKYSQKT